MKIVFKLSVIILLFNSLLLKGQDVQFSQYYNSTLFANPAFAGTGNNTRIGTIYRSQWTNITNPYTTFAIWGDHLIESARSGVGLWIMRDAQGDARAHSTEVNGSYSYVIPMENGWVFRPGMSVGFTVRNQNYTNAVFGDQLDNNGNTGAASNDPILQYSPSKTFLDIGGGGLIYNKEFWFGVGFNHINTPNQSFSGVNGYDLPIRTNVQTGYKFILNKSRHKRYTAADYKEISLTPTLNFKSQGNNNQLDIGFYYTYQPILIGLWYRGIPILANNGFPNNEAIIPMIGYQQKGWSFMYSYDFTISSLSNQQTAGSHEISLIYEFKVPYKKSRFNKTTPCPNFQRTYQ